MECVSMGLDRHNEEIVAQIYDWRQIVARGKKMGKRGLGIGEDLLFR